MRISVDIDNELLSKTAELTGIKDRNLLVSEALKVLIELESAKRLSCLGGSEPQLEQAMRRQSEL